MAGLLRRTVFGGLAFVFSLALPATPGAAQDDDQSASEPMEVDVELVLAVDVSWSMDSGEQLIQRQGYAAAFRDPTVVSAMIGGYHRRIAVTYLEWASETAQRQTVPWTLIDSPEDAEAFAQAIENASPASARGTSISAALATAANLIETNDYAGAKRVIDISGDGQNISGPPVTPVRDWVADKGIIINGLPLMLRPFEAGDLGQYYEDNVIAGFGAFVIRVEDVQTLESSIRQKLILEIAGVPWAKESERASLE
jgi:hypothetical protein